MAQLNGITFIGGLGNVTAYTQRGSDKVILRRKGGPSRAMVKNDARFDVQRRYGQDSADAPYWARPSARCSGRTVHWPTTTCAPC